jgi:hypothetical protein
MAKIEPWEERIRKDMEEFAYQLNIAYALALMWQDMAAQDDLEHVESVDLQTPGFVGKLIKPARDLFIVSQMIKQVIELDEEEQDNPEHRRKVMQPIIDFTNGMQVSLDWTVSQGRYRLNRVLAADDDDHPLQTTYLVFCLDEYLNRYKDLVHLGNCRLCHTIYLKPKHGQKMRYCSAACRQKAYRQRKAEGVVTET